MALRRLLKVTLKVTVLTLFDTLYPVKDEPPFTRDLLPSSSGGI
jgi:hypothetical protein